MDIISDILNIFKDSIIPSLRYIFYTYQYLLLIIFIILFILILFIVLFFTIILPYICYVRTFKKEKDNQDAIDLPDQQIYNLYKDLIIKDILDVRKLSYEELTIKSFDGLNLYARYYEYEKDSPIEIMFHGYRGSAERDLSTGVKRAFACGRSVVLVDQRASGKSEGKTITFGINERIDAKDWSYYVSNKFGKSRKIILTGISMGAATVLMASSLNLPENVIGVLADCPYNKPRDIILKVVKDMRLPPKLVFPFIKLGAKIYGKFDIDSASPIESVKHTTLPIIFYHGSSDDYVPCFMSEKLFSECISEKKLVTIEGGMHGTSYLKDPEKYLFELKNFFKDK